MRGRKPKPTFLHLVDGTDKARRPQLKARAEQEVQPERGVRGPPAGFNADQQAVWARLQEDIPPGMLARTDFDCLVGYAVLVAARDNALELFNRSGASVLVRAADERQRFASNPALREFRRLTEQLRLLQGELGFTPAARSRVTRVGDEADDPLADFLG